jgi:hypothetical protein
VGRHPNPDTDRIRRTDTNTDADAHTRRPHLPRLGRHADTSPTPTPPTNSLRLDAELQRLQNVSGAVVTVVALAPDDRWLLAYDDTPANLNDATKASFPADAPVSLRNKLAEIAAAGGRVPRRRARHRGYLAGHLQPGKQSQHSVRV